ncbi:MAG: transaldolase [Epsilonproteobacteria bacterium]|nr:transaldolase [Campylobacterota bacterium]
MASIWVDYLERDFLDGEFKELVKSGLVSGITSNPAIFANAILHSDAYMQDIKALKGSPKEIYEALAIKDIQKACDVLSDVYKNSQDGYASIEVDPQFAHDSDATIKEALRLYNKIDRPNVMIKIPATKEGYVAMKQLAKEGINLNATLVFSPTQAMQCLEALSYLPQDKAGVISVFVSRFDRELNPILAKHQLSKDRIGFFNAIKIYNQIQSKNVNNVRVLFASTGVKQDYLPKDYYVKQLYLPNSILTLPLDVIHAIKDEELDESFHFQTKHIDAFFSYLTPANISMQKTYDKLTKEGLKAFEESFADMLTNIKN